MQKITPFLWYDKEAREAAKFYTSIFNNSSLKGVDEFFDTPSGAVDVVTIQLAGQEFTLMSAGPQFKFTPAVSFIVNFDPSREKDAGGHMDAVWKQLSHGGTVLMALDKYPFSERYGWLQDKYGLSWQLILSNPDGEERPFIVPSLMFVGNVCGKAEEAMTFYLSVCNNAPPGPGQGTSKMGAIHHYGAGQEPDTQGTVMFADFMLFDQWFAAMDSAHGHKFTFNEANSFVINCNSQEEVDYYWEKLTSGGGQESMCGWLKDQYGLSWQIIPTALGTLLGDKDPQKAGRVMNAMLQMKKIDVKGLQQAYDGR